MKLFNTLFVVSLSLCAIHISYAQDKNKTHSLFGNAFQQSENGKGTAVFESLKVNDTLKTQFSGRIVEVCQAKGCWMKVDLQDGNQVFVRFKDYGFFVPTDAAGKNVMANGKAFLEEMSVDEQRHYAEDAGASEDELVKITSPKRTYRFEADGVLIEN
ncbi:DUF4920 domain-containing protein [Allomuricauda sp. SCSIO 65647]|uniref:DUF4920 domain-containing protein n=1 Tax=Allomuricauda sp. SCSIO 65647 TaxID=2908843 RepID=UPI001F28C72E|nr:DUF4920 domain-containing protein [Muricauda sp. SCSIO 65647]UJH66775.1 DUF4920 domain-containing protein [Muricauda sp. SCSIO 65647]